MEELPLDLSSNATSSFDAETVQSSTSVSSQETNTEDSKGCASDFSLDDTLDEDSVKPPSIPSSPQTFSPQPVDSVKEKPTPTRRKDPVLGSTFSEKAILFEYRWPDENSGDFYFIQEQVCEYIGVTSFRRKYPDIYRRQADIGERHLLLSSGAISADQEALGLTAVKSEEVLQILAQDFPEKYAQYIKYVSAQEKEKVKSAMKLCEAPRMDKDKMADYIKNAVAATAEWNAKFQKDRREKRSIYLDLQTYIIQEPRKAILCPQTSKIGAYPLALIPGQYCDTVPKKYTSDELNYLPLGSVRYGPVDFHDPFLKDDPDSEDSDREKMSDEGGSDDEYSRKFKRPRSVSPTPTNTSTKRSEITCGICNKDANSNKQGFPEQLIYCSQCDNAGHPTCLEMSPALVKVVLTYDWLCMECKTCMVCTETSDEENMLFCDNCDRGYHSYCVGLRKVPEGRWVCRQCGGCASCLQNLPADENLSDGWVKEYTRPRDKSEPVFLQLHCLPCSTLFNKGHFCPACLKVYSQSEVDSMVQCSTCERLIHSDCDAQTPPREPNNPRASLRRTQYQCVLCRGELEERMDAFHIRNKHS